MEFLQAPLKQQQTGTCDACSDDGANLTAAVITIRRDYSRRNGMKEPEITGDKAHLICADCAESHPLWRLPKTAATT